MSGELQIRSDAEYSALRRELLEYSGRIVALNKFTLVSSFAILGFAVSAKDLGWLVALFPLIVVFAASELALSHKFQIARIAAYLRIAYSGDFPYEKYLLLFRKNWRHGHPSFEISGTLVASGIVVASLSMSAILGFQSTSWGHWTVVVGIGLSLLISLWLLVRLSIAGRRLKLGGLRDKEMEDQWLELVPGNHQGKVADQGDEAVSERNV